MRLICTKYKYGGIELTTRNSVHYGSRSPNSTISDHYATSVRTLYTILSPSTIEARTGSTLLRLEMVLVQVNLFYAVTTDNSLSRASFFQPTITVVSLV